MHDIGVGCLRFKDRFFWDSCSEQCYVVGVVYFPAWFNIFVAVFKNLTFKLNAVIYIDSPSVVIEILLESTDEIGILY